MKVLKKVFKIAGAPLLCLAMGAGISACKRYNKYPESTFWRDPTKEAIFYGNLTGYKVNGIDSLDLLNSYFGSHYGSTKDIRQARFVTSAINSNRSTTDFILAQGYNISISYKFSNDRKKIAINSSISDSTVYRKNIFISYDINWQIIRLAKTGPFKLKTTLSNNNVYEIQIN